MLAKDPADRPESARAVVEALAAMREPAASPKRSRPLSKRWLASIAAGILAAVLGLAAFLYGPLIFRYATNQGELIVQVDDPEIDVVIKPDGLHLKSGKEQTLIVTAGTGVVEVRDPAKGWTLVTKGFTLKRGGQQVVRITQQEVAQSRDLHSPDARPPSVPSRFSSSERGVAVSASRAWPRRWPSGRRGTPSKSTATGRSPCRPPNWMAEGWS